MINKMTSSTRLKLKQKQPHKQWMRIRRQNFQYLSLSFLILCSFCYFPSITTAQEQQQQEDGVSSSTMSPTTATTTRRHRGVRKLL